MAEGLALAASVIAVLQITNSVLSVCYEYRAIVHTASGELSKVVAEMKSLRDVLESLEPLAEQAESANPTAGTRMPTLALLCRPQGLLERCSDEVAHLEERLKTPSWADSFGPRRKAVTQALRWPLNKAKTEEILENIGRFKSTLNLAITADEVTLTLAIQNLSLSTNHVVLETQEDVRLMRDTVSGLFRNVQSTNDVTLAIHQGMERKEIYKWLAAPDPSTNYNRASCSRQAKTGIWFLESETFTQWKEQNSLVWLHGKPGCGKTVLSSTIVNEVLQESRSNLDVAVAYFFFDFNDLEKQKSDKMIRSLITQLSRQSMKKLDGLESLFSSCNNGGREPDVEGLLIVLKELVESFDETYIVLDALDECSDRGDLLDCIEEVRDWKLRQVHLLTTSRRLIDIEERLEPLISPGSPRNKICIQSAMVNADIRFYVQERLQNDRRLKRWQGMPQVLLEIETTLMEKADGMFRWAVCQLDALQNCHRLPTLRKALGSLPETLDETYARILCNIAEEDSEDAIKILQWLTYSARPLRIEEVAEVVAVNIDGSPWFDREARFPDQQDVLAMCSSLLVIEDVRTEEDDPTGDNPNHVVRLAHFSVKEYLVSERVRNQAAAKYAIQEIQANQFIAAACIAYLLQFDQHDSVTSRTITEFPLAPYAAEYWMDHTRVVGENLDAIEMLILEFCKVPSEVYSNWFRFCDPEKSWDGGFDLDRKIVEMATPLYYASLAGVNELARLLLEKGADVTVEGGVYGNALQAASIGGHLTVVQLLVEEGADINAKGGHYGNTLQAASIGGHLTVMQLLVEKGADVNAEGGYFGSALQAASAEGHLTVVQLLLKKGADVNAVRGLYGNALRAASTEDYPTVVQLLLERGADVSAKGGHFGSALQAASSRGHHTVMQQLLKKGTDVNAEGGFYGSALLAASAEGHSAVVQLLLEKGADVNAKGGVCGGALQKASGAGHSAVVQLLLEKGADVNAEGGFYGSALQAASAEGHLTVVQLLLERGADINAEGEHYDSALQTASSRGHHTVVQQLLKKGADVNAEGGFYGSALLAASAEGHHIVVQLLLKKGADVNAKGGVYDNALQAASAEGHLTVVQLLLERGPDVNAKGGVYGSALQAASTEGHPTVMQLLLERGADVHAEGGYYGNALQAASSRGNLTVVQQLLKEGADVNAKGGHYGNALEAASAGGHLTIVQQLLEKGADVRIEGGKYGSALQAVAKDRGIHSISKEEREAIVQLLQSAMDSQAPSASSPTADELTNS